MKLTLPFHLPFGASMVSPWQEQHLFLGFFMTTDTSDAKIRKLCETLEKEALAPAQLQAEQLINTARGQADSLVKDAQNEVKTLIVKAREQIEQERGLFDSSLRQAAALAKQALRNDFEERLFRPNLEALLELSLADPVIMTRLIRSVIDAIERDGLGCDLSVEVAKSIDIKGLNALLGEAVLKKLRDGSCLLANISSGARIQVRDRGLTVDLSDQFLSEILQKNLHSSFAKTFFQNV